MNRDAVIKAKRIVIKIGSSTLTGADGAGLDSAAVTKLAAAVAQNYKVTVLNTLGEVVYEYQLADFAGEHKRMIDLSTLSKGVYVINVTGLTKNVMRKITVY